nr:hypothetical protein [Winslowiella toletana]
MYIQYNFSAEIVKEIRFYSPEKEECRSEPTQYLHAAVSLSGHFLPRFSTNDNKILSYTNNNKALKALQGGQALTGKNGILTPLIK